MKLKIKVIFLIAFFIRMGLLIRHHHTEYLSGLTQGLLARNIVMGRGFVTGEKESKFLSQKTSQEKKLIDIKDVPFYKDDVLEPWIYDMPGHGILTALIWKITGDFRYIYVQILQILIDALMIFLIFFIGKELFGEKVGILFSVLYAVYLPQAFLSIFPLRDCWPTFVSIIFVFSVIKYKWCILAGITLGIGVYMRPNLLLFGIFVSFFSYFYLRDKIRTVKLLLSAVIIPAIFLLPWWLRNYKIFHRFIPLTTNLGHVLWVGMGVIQNPYGFEHKDEAATRFVREKGYDYSYMSPEYSNVLKRRVFEVIKKDPVYYLKVLMHRIPVLLFPGLRWGIEPSNFSSNPRWLFPLWREKKGGGIKDYVLKNPFQGLYMVLRRVLIAVFLFLSLWGVFKGFADKRISLFLFSVPFYFVIVHLFLDADPRYVFPGTWVYLVFTSVFCKGKDVAKF